MHLAALRVHATMAITAVVDQDSRGVHGLVPTELLAFRTSLRRTIRDAVPDAIKIGMVASVAHAVEIAEALEEIRDRGVAPPVVLDPVLAGGTPDAPALHEREATRRDIAAAVWALAHRARAIVTPNVGEARTLLDANDSVSGVPFDDGIASPAAVDALVARWRSATALPVLLKGGHAQVRGVDRWVDRVGDEALDAHAWAHEDIHGTGCALASAIAAALARGATPRDAVVGARAWLSTRVASYTAVVGHGRRQFVASAFDR
jgi:hydroxymethylpyrimidine/phosphomethylpyrimidine kinase